MEDNNPTSDTYDSCKFAQSNPIKNNIMNHKPAIHLCKKIRGILTKTADLKGKSTEWSIRNKSNSFSKKKLRSNANANNCDSK